MGFFDDEEGFEDIFQDLFRNRGIKTSSSGNVVSSEREERVIDYIEEEGEVYFVFEFPGFREKDLQVNLKGNQLNVVASRKEFTEVKDYLKGKLGQEISFTKTIPVKVKKEMETSFNNGVLEVRLIRK